MINGLPSSLSADRSELVVGSFTGSEIDQPLYAVPTLGGSPRRLSDLPGQDAIWMGDSDLLVAHGGELTVVSRGAFSRTFLSFGDPTLSAYWLRWSPDHRFLRFTLSQTANNRLAEVSADGSNYHRGVLRR